jgi:uncharacterized RDD family membrane protein YckC
MENNSNQKILNYAGFWRRLSASLLDILVTVPILISIIYLFGLEKFLAFEIDENFYTYIENQKSSANRVIIDIISTVIAALYSIYFISSKKMATPGKMLFGIYVVDTSGNKLSCARATARFFASILSALLLGIGLIMIAFTKEKTSLHDLICSTRVIKKGGKDE